MQCILEIELQKATVNNITGIFKLDVKSDDRNNLQQKLSEKAYSQNI